MDSMHSRELWQKLPPLEEMQKLMDGLDEFGLREFIREVLDSVYQTEPDPKFAKILSAWHRSLRFLASPDFLTRLAAARAHIL
jgi:hypothetical protein